MFNVFVRVDISDEYKQKAANTDFSKLDRLFPNRISNVNDINDHDTLAKHVCHLYYYETGKILSYFGGCDSDGYYAYYDKIDTKLPVNILFWQTILKKYGCFGVSEKWDAVELNFYNSKYNQDDIANLYKIGFIDDVYGCATRAFYEYVFGFVKEF